MIRLPPRPEKPRRLHGPVVGRKKAKLTRKFRSGTPFTTKDFDRNYYSHLDIRRPLWEWQSGNCCYCERRRDLRREPDVEHFRPKARIDGVLGPGYWWLAYEWTNLFFACKTCNQEFKKNAFPLESGPRARLHDRLPLERPTLVDLAIEDPEPLIGYCWIVRPEPLAKPVGLDADGRGNRIIQILGLDRSNLNQERGRLISLLTAQAEATLLAIHNNNDIALRREAARIRDATARGMPFLGFCRFFFRQHDLGEYIAND